MTREEAIICLKGIKNYGRDTFNEQSDWQGCLDMAIEALKFDIDQYCKEHFVVMVDKDVWEKAEKALKREPKTGKWRQIGYDIYECSICGQDVMTGDIFAYRHCHCCGAKMFEPQERGDKE